MRVVCDTNVLVSGILFNGPPRDVLLLASRGVVTNCISGDILSEVEKVLLRPKFKITPEQVSGILVLFRDTFELVLPVRRFKVVSSDPDDDRILEAAVAAEAEIVVSGDRHLLSIGSWNGIRIVSPGDLLRQLGTR